MHRGAWGLCFTGACWVYLVCLALLCFVGVAGLSRNLNRVQFGAEVAVIGMCGACELLCGGDFHWKDPRRPPNPRALLYLSFPSET